MRKIIKINASGEKPEAKKHGGKRSGAGRPTKKQKTKTVSFRVFENSEPEIKEFFSKFSIKERTILLTNLIKSK